MSALSRIWEHVWFRPASPLGLTASRVLVSAQALWILLSRPDLPEILTWPAEFWAPAGRWLPFRFGIFLLPVAAERVLFVVLHGTLLAALVGLVPRSSCFLSGVLLYHFAPFEEAIAGMPHTSFGGLTLPVLAFFILSFAEVPAWREKASQEYRWPVALVQLLFAFSYLFPALAKLRYSGPAWFTGENIRSWAFANLSITEAPWTLWLASSLVACWAVALGTMAIELLSPLVVLSAATAMLFVPAALAFHVGIVQTLGYFFPSAPLLLLYLDWDRVHRWLLARRRHGEGKV